ncbi:MAG: hypothetical protein PF961_08565 [Planctomycetota bacterium]|jgi:predicted exporter|nr:hypothetical protein [Planctomycetota bacterium]
MNSFSRIVAVTVWVALLIAALSVVTRIKPDPSLHAVIPRGDHNLDREVSFFETRSAAQILVLETESDVSQAAITVLRDAARELERVGARPQAPPSAAAAIRLTDRVYEHLPVLTTASMLTAMEQRMQPKALTQRLRELSSFLLEPGNLIYGEAVYRDLLGLETEVLTRLSGELSQAGMDTTEDGILRHSSGRFFALLLQVDHPPGNSDRTAALMRTVNEISERALNEHEVTIRAIGSYRHFNDNYSQIWRDLQVTLPISLVLIALVLFSLFRRARDLLALHMPAIAALIGGTAVVVLIQGESVPMMVLGFGAGMLGIAVDYGIHMTRAARDGIADMIRKPLSLSFITAASAFLVLLTANVDALRTLGIFVVSGLGFAVLTATMVLPRILRRRKRRDPWGATSDALVDFTATKRWWGLALAIAITIGTVPGLLELRMVGDPQDLDGSSQETRDDLAAFRTRWGLLSGNHFVVAEAKDLDTAVGNLIAAKERAGLPPVAADLLLPPPNIQAQRLRAWTDFWRTHSSQLAADLQVAAREAGLRASPFRRSFASYGRLECPPISRETWRGTPLDNRLNDLVSEQPDGSWQVVSPLTVDDPERFAAIATEIASADDGTWLASRRLLGHHLVDAMGDSLRQLGFWVALVMIIVLVAMIRNTRRTISVILPPAIAVVWTFGIFGHIQLELSALHILVATFVAGVGIDDAIFLSRSELRSHAMSPILATTATSLAGVGAMAFAGHPAIQSVGIAVFIGMAACLAACLLICPAFDRKRERPTIKTVDLASSPLNDAITTRTHRR